MFDFSRMIGIGYRSIRKRYLIHDEIGSRRSCGKAERHDDFQTMLVTLGRRAKGALADGFAIALPWERKLSGWKEFKLGDRETGGRIL